jgi:hypothetical protein
MDDRIPAPRNQGRLAERRSAVIETLKSEFAEGGLQLDEFEDRVTAAENAKAVEELDHLVSDLRQRPAEGFAKAATDSEKIFVKMATKRLSGTILSTRRLEIEATMSTVRIDYREARPIRGVQEIDVNLGMSNLILYLPDDVAVENRVEEDMSTFREIKNKYYHPDEAATILRITGTARMSTIKVKRKRYWFFSKKRPN